MRSLYEIKNDKRLIIKSCVGGEIEFTLTGTIELKNGRSMFFVVGNNEHLPKEPAYEHVSVSFISKSTRKHCGVPTWSEMCLVKDIFFDDEEEVYQIHPKKSEYVNIEECLHLWRRKDGTHI